MTTSYKRYEKISQGYDPTFSKLDFETKQFIEYIVAKQVDNRVKDRVADQMDRVMATLMTKFQEIIDDRI